MPPYRENHKKQKKKIQFIADGDHGRDDDLVLNNFKLFYFQFLYSFIKNKIDEKKKLL